MQNLLKEKKSRISKIQNEENPVQRDFKKDISVQGYILRVGNKAYELYEKRGCQDGHDWEDWFTAEQILRGDNYL